MTVPERLAALRSYMKEIGIDACMIPTDDFHSSEYVGDFFRCRAWLTGFTGSAGTAVVTQDFAGVWTDGRYFIQAAAQLAGSGFELMKMGQEDVPTILEFLCSHLKEGQVLGFDGRCVTTSSGEQLEAALAQAGVSVRTDVDPVGAIWEDRPALSCKSAWILSEVYAGRSRKDKIALIRKAMAKEKATYLLLTSLDDIAWLLNIRGDDVECNPVVLSYLLLSQSKVKLFAQENAFSPKVRKELAQSHVDLLPYEDVSAHVAALQGGRSVWIDPSKVSIALTKQIPENVRQIRAFNPTLVPKAAKNSIEVANMRKAHILDGVAVTRFIYWLKQNVGKEEITELSADVKLQELRREAKSYLGPSFNSIIAYGPHAAITHYSASPESNAALEPHGFVLADTGGHYLQGTTDITRTIVLGETTQQEKEYFTRVLRGHLNLLSAKFLYGCTGRNLDYLAREPLWEIGEDYNHGTGHGVGFLLNVHEGPNGFRWKTVPERVDAGILEEGMITSDEPGYYLEGAFGIRHENLIVCVKDEKRPCGQFMRFEPLTLVPFDLDAVLPEMMTEKEIELLNNYHALVYKKIASRLPEAEKAWLKEATRPISKA